MAEYIEREALIKRIGDILNTAPMIYGGGLALALTSVRSIPAADVEPVRHGRWLDTYGDSWKCSVCGAESYVDEDWRKTDDRAYKMNYCHYCGAKMDAQKEEGEG